MELRGLMRPLAARTRGQGRAGARAAQALPARTARRPAGMLFLEPPPRCCPTSLVGPATAQCPACARAGGNLSQRTSPPTRTLWFN
jgi:hypothetical protein